MRCVCGNAIEGIFARLGSPRCRLCRENLSRHEAALGLRLKAIACPSPGCPQMLALDDETTVLRCAMHGPMQMAYS
jgi:hypothetical protein